MSETYRAGGRTYLNLAGLMLEAREQEMIGSDTQLLQAPNAENGMLAIAKVTVFFEDKRSYSALGDASPQSVRAPIAPHIVRMAETRALVRALRWALGKAECSEEELNG